jgi:hypothetical protein
MCGQDASKSAAAHICTTLDTEDRMVVATTVASDDLAGSMLMEARGKASDLPIGAAANVVLFDDYRHIHIRALVGSLTGLAEEYGLCLLEQNGNTFTFEKIAELSEAQS